MPAIITHSPFEIHHLPVVDSTNDYLKAMTEAPEWTCAMADQQTAGRGRHAHPWHSAPGEGLYLSILLRPPAAHKGIPLLSLMTAIVVAETLIELGVAGVDIKWPNDVLVNERKISGILVESAGFSIADSLRVIVGVGVNLNHTAFPEHLRDIATSYRIERGSTIEIDEFRDRLLDRFARWYERWREDEEPALLDRWRSLSSYAEGKEVLVVLNGDKLTGVTAGINDDGALLVRTDNGQVRAILAGEVMKLRKTDRPA